MVITDLLHLIPFGAWSWIFTALGIVGLLAAGSKRRYGWMVCFSNQPLWAIYGMLTTQYGFICSSGFLGTVYLRNFLLWGRRPNDLPEVKKFDWVVGSLMEVDPSKVEDIVCKVGVFADDILAREVKWLAEAESTTPAVILSRILRGCLVAAVFSETAAIAYCWMTKGPEYAPMIHRTIKADAYIWNGWVHPNHRSNGMLKEMLSALCLHAAVRWHSKRVVAGASKSNAASWLSLIGVGFEPYSTEHCLRAFGIPIYRRSKREP